MRSTPGRNMRPLPMRLERIDAALPQGVVVWRLAVDVGDDAVPAALDAAERAHAAGLLRRADRARFLQTRAALRHLLGHRLGCAPAAVRFATDPGGKPRLAGGVRPAFNVSHAGEWALLALAGVEAETGAVGVDIERCDPARDLAGLHAAILAPGEDPGNVGFHARWVAKEACVKAVGRGIADVQAVRIARAGDGDGIAVRTAPGWPRLEARWLPAPDGHAAALAWYIG